MDVLQSEQVSIQQSEHYSRTHKPTHCQLFDKPMLTHVQFLGASGDRTLLYVNVTYALLLTRVTVFVTSGL